jgi:hypothetical protein
MNSESHSILDVLEHSGEYDLSETEKAFVSQTRGLLDAQLREWQELLKQNQPKKSSS